MVILTKHERNVQKPYESSKFPREFGGARLLGSDHLHCIKPAQPIQTCTLSLDISISICTECTAPTLRLMNFRENPSRWHPQSDLQR